MKVSFTEAAETDLEEIGSWLSENAAHAGDMPARFPLVPGHEATGVRRRVYGAYLIFYTVGSAGVLVLRILHGARDVDRIMFPTS